MSQEGSVSPAAPAGLSALGALVRQGDADRFEAALFADDETRERLFALYAFNLELARAPWRSAEPHIVLMRLQWWRDLLEEAYAGQPPRAHEVAEPLSQLVQSTQLQAEDFEQLIQAREMEADLSSFAAQTALTPYLYGTGGALLALACQVCAGRALRAEERALIIDLGAAIGLARLLEATALLAYHGRSFLPLQAPARAALLGGQTTDAARQAIADRARTAAETMARARKARLDRAFRPALLAGWRTDRILTVAQRADLDIFKDFGPESPFRRRFSLLWRASTGRW